MTTDYTVIHTTWNLHGAEIREIRTRVFVEEQQVPLELEWEGNEDGFHYVVALNAYNQAIGTGRMNDKGHIGRMAVLKEWRQKGVGCTMLVALMKHAHDNEIRRVYLNAQTSAIPFYEKQGFTTTGEEFMEAGIPHRAMEKYI